jgi:hypothetical protein
MFLNSLGQTSLIFFLIIYNPVICNLLNIILNLRQRAGQNSSHHQVCVLKGQTVNQERAEEVVQRHCGSFSH